MGPKRRQFGREARGLALARLAVEIAGDADRSSAYRTLAWALHANGLNEEALAAGQSALVHLVTEDEESTQITVSAVDFVASDASLEPVPAPGILEHLYRHTGTFVNALAALIAIFILLQFGLRPVASMMVAESPAIASEESENPQIALESRQIEPAEEGAKTAEIISAPELAVASEGDAGAVMDGPPKLAVSAEPIWRERLQDLLDDEQRAAAVMREWIHEEVNA